MVKQILKKREKKVEYIELIYDLIFVYIIGRNNSLLHHTENGFIQWGMFFSYIICTLAVIQIWNYTTYYINAYGRNSIRDHIFLFVNMFLLYFLGEGTKYDWQESHHQYHIAWALILINIAVQYLIETQNHKGEPPHINRIVSIVSILFTEAILVILAIPEFEILHTTYISCAAILLGIVANTVAGRKSCSAIIDFEHLSERAMLYVVFTFGEMIIAIAGYFEGEFNFNSIYFAFMAFMIVVGLFLSYGIFYDHIVDRKMQTNGLGYMFVHIFIIFALNNITTALEFMRNEAIHLVPKISFLILSFIIYYVFLFSMGRYAKNRCHLKPSFHIISCAAGIVFIAMMFLFREKMFINIAVTVAFVFAILLILHQNEKKLRAFSEQEESLCGNTNSAIHQKD